MLPNVINKKLILFGTGSASIDLTLNLGQQVSYYIDNNSQKRNNCFLNAKVYHPEQLLKENPNDIVIVIASSYYSEIAKQLTKMGFSENIHFWNGKFLLDNGSYQNLYLEYPISPKSRWGYGRQPHYKLQELISCRRNYYQKNLESFKNLTTWLKQIPVTHIINDPIRPCWKQTWLPLDGISLYSFLALRKPQVYLEVGSGNSTKFARQAISDHHLDTSIISIDPQPRAEIDQICDQIIRQPLEEADLTVFNQLDSGDVLFIDNSHQCFMNSDVTVAFLDVLPYLKKGVLVGFHDIFLPYDYPPKWIKRFYSEQYLLACYLLAEGGKFQIELPNAYISHDFELINILSPIWNSFQSELISKGGGAFWIEIT